MAGAETAGDLRETPFALETEDIIYNAVRPLDYTQSENTPMEICQGAWPFDWSTVDIPGSPGLTRLFEGLKIESDTHIPSLALDSTDSHDPSCLSHCEIEEVFNRTTQVTNGAMHQVRYNHRQRYFLSLVEPSEARQPHYPWRDIDGVFCGYATSPLMEIYVFPPSPQPKVFRKPVYPLWTRLLSQEQELGITFTKLNQQLPADSPAVVAVMESLAYVLYRLQKYIKAESIYRKLAGLYERTFGPQSTETLRALRMVIWSLSTQGSYSKAKSLNDKLQSVVCKLVQPHHALATGAANIEAYLAMPFARNDHSERIYRMHLQMKLTSYGARHPDTIRALSLLGYSMSQSGKSEGRTLLRTALRLSLDAPFEDQAGSLGVALDLAYTLHYHGCHDESYRVASKALELFRPILGVQHKSILSLEERRAWCLLAQGELIESEKLFRDLVYYYLSDASEKPKRNEPNPLCGLADALAEMGRREEATGWYEKYIEMRLSDEGEMDSDLMATCYKLAYCYEEQDRVEAALNVYHRMADKFRMSWRDTSAVIAAIESEMSWIKTFIEHRSIDADESEDDYSHSGSPFSSTEDVAGKKGGGGA